MKTYIVNIAKKFFNNSISVDASNVLCDKTWLVFNEDGYRQVFIFQSDGVLYVSTNGDVIKTSWKYIPANKSIIISDTKRTVMFHPIFLDNMVFVLQKDGTEECMFLIDEMNIKYCNLKTLQDIITYFNDFSRFRKSTNNNELITESSKSPDNSENKTLSSDKQVDEIMYWTYYNL